MRFLGAADATAAFTRGDATFEFHHCRTCGCTTHWWSISTEAPERMAINARLIDPAALEGVPVRLLDGAGSWSYLS